MLNDKEDIPCVRSKKKYFIIFIIVGFITLFAVGSYHTVHLIITKSDMAVIEELAVHDIKAINNTLNEQWNSLEILCDAMQSLGIDSEHDIITTMQALASHKENSIICLVSDDGTFIQSDGVINRQEELFEFLTSHGEDFAASYNCDEATAAELKRQHLLIGKKLDGLTIAGHSFIYAFRKADISELDDLLEIDSFGGKGHASVTDKNGDYIIYKDRTASVVTRDNLFQNMKNAKFKTGYSYEKVMKSIENISDSAVTFQVEYEGVDYLINVTDMGKTQWYYVSLVPMEVFSQAAYSVLSLIWLYIAIMFVIAFISIYRELRANAERERDAREQNVLLKNALDTAQEANKAKTIFLRSMSHDIRTPMNAICGFTELALQYIDNRRMTVKYLLKINESSTHLLELINDILDMSRIESGTVSIQPERISLSAALLKTRDLFVPSTSKKGQTLVWNTSGIKNDLVSCDELRLSQVLINILSNAVKYTPREGVITFWVEQRPGIKGDTEVYEFYIRDNGIGMSEEFVSTIFEPFTRENTPTKSQVQGTGLGMTITKNLVTLMEGTIECQSRSGEGTEMIVCLPLLVYKNSQPAENEPEVIETDEVAAYEEM